MSITPECSMLATLLTPLTLGRRRRSAADLMDKSQESCTVRKRFVVTLSPRLDCPPTMDLAFQQSLNALGDDSYLAD